MAISLLGHGAFVLEAKYIELRRGTYYFRRRIPQDVRRHYPGRKDVEFFSLKTKDPQIAAKKAHQKALEQDALWEAWRTGQDVQPKDVRRAALAILDAFEIRPNQYKDFQAEDIEPDRFLDELRHQSGGVDGQIHKDQLPPEYREAAELFYGKAPVPYFSEAVDLYVKMKAPNESPKNKKDRQRVVDELFSVAGDLPVDQYSRKHANDLVARLMASGIKTTSVKRKINFIAPVMSNALREHEINKVNVFSGLNITGLGEDKQERKPFTTLELDRLATFYHRKDDDLRWCIAMLQDTGARLSEILGLQVNDICILADIPHINIQPNELRPLKNKQSQRTVPLVGVAMWGAQRLIDTTKVGWAFPRYVANGELPPEIRTLTQATICSLLIFDEKEI
ncbi:hypothetical protein CDZ97_18810, partial [Mameliella alba]|uniref:DUF6538 domain-containing protein n=2 Tax=Mameliella alba TaxID=561184 RepID=UPI000B52EEE6